MNKEAEAVEIVTITKQEAKDRHFRALTTGYRLPAERKWMDAVVRDLQRGNIAYVYVNDGNSGFIEVWRTEVGATK